MLHPLDDYPDPPDARADRASRPSSDRNFYDRYFFNGYTRRRRVLLRPRRSALYPNRGIMDCGFSVVRDGEQHAFHASRRAPREPSRARVGPIAVEIVEPMRALRVRVDANETGIAADLRWIRAHSVSGRRAALRSARARRLGRWTRRASTSSATGRADPLRAAGERCAIDPTRVYGTQGPLVGHPPGRRSPDPARRVADDARSIFFLWAPLHFDGRCTHFGTSSRTPAGAAGTTNGVIVPVLRDPDEIPRRRRIRASSRFARVEHRIEWRRARAAPRAPRSRWSTHDGARARRSRSSRSLCFRMNGIGYQHPEWGHGCGRASSRSAARAGSAPTSTRSPSTRASPRPAARARALGEARRGIGVSSSIAIGPHAPPATGHSRGGLLDPAR